MPCRGPGAANGAIAGNATISAYPMATGLSGRARAPESERLEEPTSTAVGPRFAASAISTDGPADLHRTSCSQPFDEALEVGQQMRCRPRTETSIDVGL